LETVPVLTLFDKIFMLFQSLDSALSYCRFRASLWGQWLSGSVGHPAAHAVEGAGSYLRLKILI